MRHRFRDDLQRGLTALAGTQYTKLRLMLTALVPLVIYTAAGANEIVAMMAAIGSAMPLWFALELRLQHVPMNDIPARTRGLVVVGGSGFWLSLAAGAQAVIWARGLTGEAATRFAGAAFGVVLVVALPIIFGVACWWLLSELAGWRPVQPNSLFITSLFAGVCAASLALAPVWLIVTRYSLPWSDLASLLLYLTSGGAMGVAVYRRLAFLADRQAAQARVDPPPSTPPPPSAPPPTAPPTMPGPEAGGERPPTEPAAPSGQAAPMSVT